MKYKVIGLGGIGSYLIEPLSRYLHAKAEPCEITLIDGDKYESKNENRQRFECLDNKAEHTAELLKPKFPRIHYKSKPHYLSDDNVITNIRERDVVFLCVDNHATRKLVSDRCEELDDVTLFSGGNEYEDGNVIVYVRKDGQDACGTRPPTQLHVGIANPQDLIPGESENRAGCEQSVEDNAQLLFTNLAMASTMCNCLYAYEQGKIRFEQVYVDILNQSMRADPDPLDNLMEDL